MASAVPGPRVIQIDEGDPVDIDDQDRILNGRRDALHFDVLRQLNPGAVGQDLGVVPLLEEPLRNPRIDVIREQDLAATEPLDTGRVQVVGMPMGKPHELGGQDIAPLLGGISCVSTQLPNYAESSSPSHGSVTSIGPPS